MDKIYSILGVLFVGILFAIILEVYARNHIDKKELPKQGRIK